VGRSRVLISINKRSLDQYPHRNCSNEAVQRINVLIRVKKISGSRFVLHYFISKESGYFMLQARVTTEGGDGGRKSSRDIIREKECDGERG
jgi:hypothetical protein